MNGAAIVAEAYNILVLHMFGAVKIQVALTAQGFTRYVYMQVTGRDIGGWTVPQESAGTKFQFLKQKLETCYSGGHKAELTT